MWFLNKRVQGTKSNQKFLGHHQWLLYLSFYVGAEALVFLEGSHSSGITVPVNSQESSWGGGGMTEQRARQEKAFRNNPRQGRMVILQTTHYKRQTRTPKTRGRRKELIRDHGRQTMVTWNSRLAYGHFSHLPSTGRCVIKKLLFKIVLKTYLKIGL